MLLAMSIEDREAPTYVTEAQEAFDRTGRFRAWAAVGDADGYRWGFIVSGLKGSEYVDLDIGMVVIVGPEFYDIRAVRDFVYLHPERRKVLEDVIVALGRKPWQGTPF